MPTSSENLAELKSIRRVLVYMAILLSGAILYFAKDILMPIMLGVLFTLTLSPVVRGLQAIKVPAPLGAILVVMSISAVISVGISSLSTPVGELFDSLPEIGSRISEHLTPIKETMSEISEAGDQVQELAGGSSDKVINEVVLEGPGIITSAASTVATSITSLFIALVLSIFILGSGSLFYEKIVSSVPLLSDKKRALRIVRDIESSVSRYLLTITIINLSLGVIVGGLLYAYGAPNPALWGSIAALFNYLPFMGALVGATLLATVSFGVYDSLSSALIPPLIYYVCSAMEGNVVTPYIVGRRLQLNIVAVFLTVALWGWLWGLAGALMAVPILVFINVLCEHIDALKPLGHFVSGRDVTSNK